MYVCIYICIYIRYIHACVRGVSVTSERARERVCVGDVRELQEASPYFSRRLYEVISKESNSVGKFPRLPGTPAPQSSPRLLLVNPPPLPPPSP